MKATILLLLGITVCTVTVGCAESAPEEKRVTVIRPAEKEAPKGGIPPDKLAEIQQVFYQHNSSANKCYSDVLEEKHSRGFLGEVLVLVTLEPGTSEASKVSAVKILKDTLQSKEVEDCLAEAI